MKFTTLIPMRLNDGQPVSQELMGWLFDELAFQFGGCSDEGITKGQWLDPKDSQLYRHESRRVAVVCDNERLWEARQAVIKIGKELKQGVMYSEIRDYDSVHFLEIPPDLSNGSAGICAMTQDLFYGITEQDKAGKHRLEDAQALLKEGRWRGAMYMAGYRVECLLKTKLMRMYDCRHLRELEAELQAKGLLGGQATIFTHQLEPLVRLTNAIDRMRQDKELWSTFNMVNRWIPAWRYTANLSNQDDAKDFLAAVEKLSQWIENNV